MPNIKSAKKRLRQNIATREANRSKRSYLRNRCKSVLKAAENGDLTQAESLFRLAVKTLDQAASKGLIHKNAASRKKSRLSAMIQKKKSVAGQGGAESAS